MNASETPVEGQSLEETLQKASELLGVDTAEIDFRLDRDHFLNGATTVRIFAAKKDPNNGAIRERLQTFLGEEFKNRELDAQAFVNVTNAAVKVMIEAHPGVVPEDDEALAALSEVLRGVAGDDLGDRTFDLTVKPPAPPANTWGGGRDRDRDRGPRRDDRGGRGGGGRDRDRGGRRDDRGGRGGGGRDRDRDRGGRRDDRGRGDGDRERRPRPEKDPAREAALLDQAREAIEKVLEDGQPVTIEELNSYERRLVHRAVADVAGLTTRSVGRGSLKAVRVLEGDDEDDGDGDGED